MVPLRRDSFLDFFGGIRLRADAPQFAEHW